MAKGQIATIIIVLIVIGAVVYFALPTLRNLPSLGGGGGTLQINNNIITIESYSVSDLKMFPGDQTIVSFLIQNNGDHDVPFPSQSNSIVKFYDLGGMSFISLTCGSDSPQTDSSQPHTCPFQLKPFESKRILLTLEAPSVGSLTTFKISYSIIYSYKGSRSAVIPIIDGTTRTTPLGKFTQSSAAYAPDPNKDPSYGPLELSYNFPSTGTTIQNNQVITQYWGINGQPFRLQLQLKHVGTIDGAQPVKLKSITLTPISHVSAPDMQANNYCPTDVKVNSIINRENDPKFVGPPSISAVTSGMPLVFNCQFTPDIGQNTPESNAEVSTTFSYDYTIIRSETFTVQPPEQKR